MKRFIMGLGLASALAMPGFGHAAGVLYSIHPNFFREDLRVDCLAQNFNTSTQMATVDMLDLTGTVVLTTGPLPVPPGAFTGTSSSSPGTPAVTCRYTVGGSVKKWRATGIVTTANSPYTLRAYVEAK
jgi:hypothetical protein